MNVRRYENINFALISFVDGYLIGKEKYRGNTHAISHFFPKYTRRNHCNECPLNTIETYVDCECQANLSK